MELNPNSILRSVAQGELQLVSLILQQDLDGLGFRSSVTGCIRHPPFRFPWISFSSWKAIVPGTCRTKAFKICFTFRAPFFFYTTHDKCAERAQLVFESGVHFLCDLYCADEPFSKSRVQTFRMLQLLLRPGADWIGLCANRSVKRRLELCKMVDGVMEISTIRTDAPLRSFVNQLVKIGWKNKRPLPDRRWNILCFQPPTKHHSERLLFFCLKQEESLLRSL